MVHLPSFMDTVSRYFACRMFHPANMSDIIIGCAVACLFCQKQNNRLFHVAIHIHLEYIHRWTLHLSNVLLNMLFLGRTNLKILGLLLDVIFCLILEISVRRSRLHLFTLSFFVLLALRFYSFEFK